MGGDRRHSMADLISGFLVLLLYAFRRRLFKNGEHLSIDQIEKKVVGWVVGVLFVLAVIGCMYEVLWL